MSFQNTDPQQHKIQRQVIEVHGCSSADAQGIQADLRSTYYQRLLPLIDKICSNLSSPGKIHRIDRLQIDLGELPFAERPLSERPLNEQEHFEKNMLDKFEEVFSRELANAIDEAPENESALELFDYFLRTGSVPWWASPFQRKTLEANLSELIKSEPHALRRLLQSSASQEQTLQRIVRAYPNVLLDKLLGIMAPSLSAFFNGMSSDTSSGMATTWLALLEAINTEPGASSRGSRNVWWEEVLRAAAYAENTPASEAPDFFRSIFTRLARRQNKNSDYASLINDLHRSLDNGDIPVPSMTQEIIEQLWQALGDESNRPSDRFSVQNEIYKTISMSNASSDKSRIDHSQDTPVISNFSDADVLYVANAGLVILWPFLSAFFERLGLTQEKQFKNPAAAQRAVGLLQYIIDEDESPPEPLLPLNKVLCGLAPEAVFDFGEDITPLEKEECNDLLLAVIEQAPILNNMSIAGFRASFLLRQAQLGSREDHYLLRVERETHDIVLDGFPWGVSIVRLPWMQAMMQVEW